MTTTPIDPPSSFALTVQTSSAGTPRPRTDVAIVRPPFRDHGLQLRVIGAEARYAVMAADHPLADRPAVDFADLAHEPWMDVVTDPLWCDYWRVGERRSEPLTVGATCRTLDDLFEAARAGTALGLVPESVARAQSWSHLAFVEVRDIEPSTVAIAWRSDNRHATVRNFVELLTELSTP